MSKASPPQPTEAERRERLQAEALRANLRRRKSRGDVVKNLRPEPVAITTPPQQAE